MCTAVDLDDTLMEAIFFKLTAVNEKCGYQN